MTSNSLLEKRIAVLEEQVTRLTQILESQGASISSSWMRTNQAASILGVSRDYLLEEIARSRLNPNTSDFKVGVHYRHAGRGGAARPSWQINVSEVQKILSIPIERRKGA